MATDPMLDAAGTLSINRFVGDGVTTSWNIIFAGGYMQAADVKAYVTIADVNTLVAITFIGPNTIGVSPAVPLGVPLVIYRDTPKTGPVVDFTDGAIVNETNLDKLAKQAVFTSAEMVDRFLVVSDTATEALVKADQAIVIAAATIGGDFTAFARTNLSNTWASAQNFLVGSQVGGVLIATQDYVTTSIATAIAPLATSASVAAAIVTAAGDATTKANAAQATAIATASSDATTKANAVLATVDPDWLYTLASR